MPPSEPNIPHLFIDSSTEENVLTWEAAINENPAVYQNCFVRRITHVKDLNNRVLHEYLQVIVEDKSSKFCTRLIAERLQQRDQVTIGRWKPFDHYQEKWSPEDCYYHPLELAATSEISSSGSSSSKSLEVLPLPLLTRSLPKDDLSVQRFANILGKAHWEHPDYNFIVYNCYWFSECVYEGVRAFQPTLKDHVWKYSWLKRKLWFISGAMKRAAERFLELQKHVPIGAPGNEPKVPSDEYYIKSLDEVIRLAQEVRL
ncbi:hypothetical protein Plec18167_007122 [Paecilomyces lecythidis]|uniref:PPPDE domain-containing protein n=1 Tax=Paecilomyces lecythidis TaxID=3004212 RepID=A0ABR3X5K2_9EURO